MKDTIFVDIIFFAQFNTSIKKCKFVFLIMMLLVPLQYEFCFRDFSRESETFREDLHVHSESFSWHINLKYQFCV